ncbi:MAG: 50S ribosomal protein L15 [Candidatus Omnitrophica bacterium]|nr:50S ribosomal protein L15 [Candidatus Omnitrophota bacterium]
MKLSDIGKPKDANRPKKRRGRGAGSGHGKTSCKGHKGSKSRSGHHGGPRLGFEGGQMPLIRRIPKKGFTNEFSKEFEIVNVGTLNRFKEGMVVSKEELLKENLIKDVNAAVKILGDGELTKPLTVKANSFSRGAVEKIKNAGGKIEILQL